MLEDNEIIYNLFYIIKYVDYMKLTDIDYKTKKDNICNNFYDKISRFFNKKKRKYEDDIKN
jgi:hypothetical protein